MDWTATIGASPIEWKKAADAFEMSLWRTTVPRPGSEAETARIPQSVADAARRYLGVSVMRRLRKAFPYVAVVFRDDNVTDECFQGVELNLFQSQERVVTVQGPATWVKDGLPREPWLLVNVGLDDLFGLSEGMEIMPSPQWFYYCMGKASIPTPGLIMATESAENAEDLSRTLVKACDVLMFPGPDCDLYIVLSIQRANLESF